MPSLSSLSEGQRILLLGHSGSGKTGSLASLAASGYKLRIIDLDKGLQILAHYLTNPNSEYVKKNPKAVENVSFLSFADQINRSDSNGITYKKSEAFTGIITALQDWRDEGKSYGAIQSWDEDTILVIDTLSFLSNAIYVHVLAQNCVLNKTVSSNEGRRLMYAAQQILRNFMDILRDTKLKCHIIMIAHIAFATEMGDNPKDEEGKWKDDVVGFPATQNLGRALSPHIPRWFNNTFQCTINGPRHIIRTKTAGDILMKSSAPCSLKPSYGIEWGLAEIFEVLTGKKMP